MTRQRRLFAALCAAAGLVVAAPHRADGQDFILYTQNMLRFGHGSRTANQCAALQTISHTVDIILIQELMKPASPCAPTAFPGFTWVQSGPKGKSSYIEYYGFLIRTAPRPNGPTITVTNTVVTAANQYSRPPEARGLVITPYGSTVGRPILIGTIHSVFGKTVGPRRDEAKAATGFLQYLTTYGMVPPATNPAIIAGDWNIEVIMGNGNTDDGWSQIGIVPALVAPDSLTSLTKTGNPSSAYDHFLYTRNTLVIDSTRRNPDIANWPTWRKNVSDHLGVYAFIRFQ